MAGKRGKYNKSHDGMTHTEIGVVLGISGQRVKQIEDAAFKKIKATFSDLAVFVNDCNDGVTDSSIYHI